MHPFAAQFDQVLYRLSGAKRIILATHEDPDGDGLGALLAFALWLKEASPDKEVVSFVQGRLPAHLRFLPGIKELQTKIPEGRFDLLVGFDYADFSRIGLDGWVRGQQQIVTITFDHHPEGRHRGGILIVDPSAPSTTSLVFGFFKHSGLRINSSIATAILTGLVVDTGGFLHTNTTTEAFSIAGEMMKNGADLRVIFRESFRKKDPVYIRLWGEALLRIYVDRESGLALSRVTSADLEKYGAPREAMIEFSDLLNSVDGSRCSAFLSQDPGDNDCIKGSLRSEDYKGVDVSRLASYFGGGGHRLAAGFKIKGEWPVIIAKLIVGSRRLTNGTASDE